MSEIRPDELLAQRYVDGVLSPSDQERARRWLAEDASFRALVEELEAVRAAFPREEDRVQAPPGFAARVAFAARVERREGGAGLLVSRLSWAAALVILLGLGAIAGLQITRSGDTLRAEGELKFKYNDLLQQARRQEGERRRMLGLPPAEDRGRREEDR